MESESKFWIASSPGIPEVGSGAPESSAPCGANVTRWDSEVDRGDKLYFLTL